MKEIAYKILPFITTLLLVVSACTQKDERQDSMRSETMPNIVFIMADDMGYADAGSYGQKLIKTPNIDKLAAEGLRFTQCYSGSSVCAPARSVLMTGLHTGHTRVRGNFGLGGVIGLAGKKGRVPLRKEDITIAELLQEAGYRTAMVGKWGLGEPNTSGEPNKKGFDEFYGFLNQRRAHSYYPDYIWKNKEKVILKGNKEGKGTDYTHDLFADYALDFIKRNAEKPFFLYLPLCIPHGRYELPDQGDYKNENWTDDARSYAAMISRMDNSVGRVMAALKDAGIDDNTYVFFTSDNGASGTSEEWKLFDSNSPLRGIKRDPYEGGIRVPMIVRHPSVIKSGSTSNVPWYFADVLPTLSELLGISIPKNIDGVSIASTIAGTEQLELHDRMMYWEFYEKEGWRAIRMGKWKAIQHNMHKKDRSPIELYDIGSDISENNDVADKYPEIVKQAERLFAREHVPSEHYVWKYLAKNEEKLYDQ
ncbi:MAG: arylsulfatase A-like enzyme [Saprospiraceae bacterium]|jgi:arylsulfatase A-like enzyme